MGGGGHGRGRDLVVVSAAASFAAASEAVGGGGGGVTSRRGGGGKASKVVSRPHDAKIMHLFTRFCHYKLCSSPNAHRKDDFLKNSPSRMETEPLCTTKICCRKNNCCIEKLLLASASCRDAAARGGRECEKRKRKHCERAHSKPENRETQTDGRTDGRKEGRKEGRKDVPCFCFLRLPRFPTRV